jgi:predicted RNA-binding Zn-ribbon protein involved in translation (DUF1610 family)
MKCPKCGGEMVLVEQEEYYPIVENVYRCPACGEEKVVGECLEESRKALEGEGG